MIPVTRADVARLAGVSPSTVTYALTGDRSVSRHTQARVLEAVERLGYRPNASAAALASRRVRSVGVLLRLRRTAVEAGDLPYVDGIRSRVEPEDIQVVIPMGLREDPVGGVRALIRSHSIGSAILMDVAADDEREEVLLHEGVPTVLIGSSGRLDGAPSIDADFTQMAVLALNHLAALGHRRVLLLTRVDDDDRARAYVLQRGALLSASQDLGVTGVLRCLPSNPVHGARLVTRDGLVQGCTAIVSNNPGALSGVLAGAATLGLRVPKAFSVVSVGVDTWLGEGERMVTASAIDAHAMGYEAGDMLLRLIAHPGIEEHLLHAPRLHERGTTAPPPSGH
ncbi:MULTISPECIES: LacI family DNA-binding transcriptional regulator [Actinomyces]|uniref:LacI family DNA-binding transcriptional regulator n=1 Tax=Actinomyces respiraculi TaxID=2744574 RepID=A0A7T0LM61_9ACTO|nr:MULTISPECIES: LacI family DNA-binding transcriptional regulator [Actinomyces]QPL05966.1 LacI family DNA-binding transcriptional regulator [Actinomyces respiraculi]